MKYLAGWGTLLEQCFDEICHFIGLRPDFICDNAIEKHGKTLHGIPCIPFAAARNDPDAEFFITIRNHRGIARQLASQGHQRIHCVHFERSYYKLTRITSWPPPSQSSPTFPSDFFYGKNILVTGASRGLGARLAIELASLGANLTLHARKIEHLETTKTACQKFGHSVDVFATNLEHPEKVQAMIQALRATGLGIIYNNAAFSPSLHTDHYQIPANDFELCFKINALAPILLANAFIPDMQARGFGRVINISTELQHHPASAAYACSKAALDKFVADLAPTLAGTGVNINLVNPGSLRTDMNPRGEQAVESAVNGLLLAALLEQGNGRWISAQDYSGLPLQEAYSEAISRLETTTT